MRISRINYQAGQDNALYFNAPLVASTAPPKFSSLSHAHHDVQKEILNIKNVFRFSLQI